MWKTTIKGLLAHKLRMMLTALAVVLGVGFIAGTYVLTDTINSTFDNLFSDVTRGVDVYVRAENSFEVQEGGSRKPISENLLSKVMAVDGVDRAAGSVFGYAQIVDKKGEAVTPNGAPTIGVNWEPEPLGSLSIREGREPSAPDEVVIDAGTAEDSGFEPGDPVTILSLQGSREFSISGIAGFGEADNLAGATLAAFETETAQRLLDREGKFDSIDVAGEPDVSTAELRTRIGDILPEGTEAVPGTEVASEQTKSIQEGLGFFNIALLIFAGVALFVGAFIIFNTFSITVAQRTREFGLLRALGASGAQVMASVVVEALLVGIVASVVGLGVGVLIAVGLNSLLSAFGIDLPSSGLQFLPRTIIVSMSVGIIVTLVSAIAPARRAARISPMAALRESAPQSATASRSRTLVGVGISALGAGLLLFGLFGSAAQPAALVGAGALVLFLGVAFLVPLFAGPLARVIGAPIARILRLPGRLAQQNAARNPRRTAATAAALMIGLALVGLVSIFASSLKASTNKVVDESLKADFTVSGASFAGAASISPKVSQAIAESEAISAVAPVRVGQFRYDQTKTFFLSATDPSAFDQVADIDAVEGDLSSLGKDELFLYTNTADDLGLEVRDEITMEFAATGEQQLTVAGLYENKSLTNSDYLVSLETWDENFTDRVDSIVLVKAADGVAASEARAAVESATKPFPNVEVKDQAGTKAQSAQQVDQLLGLVTALLGLALIIALMGITNTLALSIFERTREIGLMRAIGMSRKQTRSMIRWESVIIAIIGAVLGLIIGAFFGWALVTALESEGITELAIPSGQLIIYVVVAGLAGIIAAIPPARRAARLKILEAIATE